MKKSTVIIILIICILLDVQRVSAAEARFYTKTGKVVEIDKKADTVTWSDINGNLFYFYGISDHYENENITIVMFNNMHIFTELTDV